MSLLKVESGSVVVSCYKKKIIKNKKKEQKKAKE